MATQSLHDLSKSFTVLSRDGKHASTNMKGLVHSLFSLKKIVGAISLYKLTNSLAGATKSAMDMTESIHLYNVAMGEFAESTVVGINALSQISGLDNTKLLDTVGSYNLLARSMGVANENAVTLSTNTTKLAIDLSALTNRSIQKVSEDLRSGLIGQAKTMYKYGIDVTEASIKQEALNRGITKSVRHMTQAEKMTLRYAVMIKQASLSHGDFAHTIETPANQLRIFSERILTLGRTIGSVFIPMISKVLPYLNAMAQVLTRIFGTLAKLVGYTKPIVENMQNGFSGASEEIDEATGSANKLKKALQSLAGFDEINVIGRKETDTPSGGVDGGGGFDIDLEGYDNLLDGVKQKSDELFESMMIGWEKFNKALIPVKASLIRLWEGGLSKLGDFTFGALTDLWNNLLKPIGMWVLGEKGLPRFIRALDRMLLDIDYQAIRDALNKLWEAILPFAENVGEGLFWLWENVLLPLAKWVGGDLLIAFLGLLTGAFKVMNSVVEALKPLGIWLWEEFLKPLAEWTGGKVIEILEGMTDSLEKLSTWIDEHQEIVQTATIIIGSFALAWGLVNGAVKLIKGSFGLLKGAILLATSPIAPWVLLIGGLIAVGVLLWKNWETIKEKATQIFGDIVEWIKGNWSKSWEDTKEAWVNVGKYLNESWEQLKTDAKDRFDKIKESIVDSWNGVINFFKVEVPKMIGNIVKFFSELPYKIGFEIGKVLGTLATWGTNVIGWIVVEVPKFIKKIVDFFVELPKKIADEVEKVKQTISTWVSNAVGWVTTEVPKVINAIVQFFIDLPPKMLEKMNLIKNTIGTWVSNSIGWVKAEFPKLMNSIIDFFAGLPSKMVDVGTNMIQGLWNGILSMGSWLSDKISGFLGKGWDIAKDLFTGLGSGFKATYNPVQKFARGGMPTAGSIFMAGESGAELMGTHRGQTTVMPLEDSGFVTAMKQAVIEGVTSAMGGGNQGGIEVNIGGKTIVDILSSEMNRQSRINGRVIIDR